MVALVIPALNEGEIIGEVVRSIPTLVDRVIVVDNGSTDDTAKRAEEAGALVVAQPARGYGRACRAGMHAAIAGGADIIVFIDGDGSDCPEFLEALVTPILRNKYDFVIGSRIRGEREPGSLTFQQVFAGRLAGWMLQAWYGVKFTDMSPFRAIRRSVLEALPLREETYGWNLEMQMLVARAKVRILEIPVNHRRRQGGVSKVSGTVRGTLLAGLRIASTFLRVAFTAKPAR
ncbi:MAG: glycosyltransferase family 2 protein [Chthoniobacterales bacterium]|jgi:glycosyltransferase involved in cell wall biosynthesis